MRKNIASVLAITLAAFINMQILSAENLTLDNHLTKSTALGQDAASIIQSDFIALAHEAAFNDLMMAIELSLKKVSAENITSDKVIDSKTSSTQS